MLEIDHIDHPRQRVPLLAVAAAGIALQLLQTEDPTPVYRYFTVWSAILVCVYGSGLFSRVRGLDAFVGTCGSAGAVFSGVVYLVAIAPANGLGHEVLTITANVVLHIALPITVIALYRSQRSRLAMPAGVVVALGFPAAYLAYSLLGSSIFDSDPVYAFLDTEQVGRWGVLAAALGGGFAYSLTVWMLSKLPQTT